MKLPSTNPLESWGPIVWYRGSIRAQRLLTLFLGPHVIFIALSIATASIPAITLLNFVLFAISSGVCIAFSPIVWSIFYDELPLDRSDYLAFGIWLGFWSLLLRTGVNIVWRLTGMHLNMINTPLTTYIMFTAIAAGILHLLAPEAVKSKIPPRQWLRLGVVVTASLLLAFGVGYLFNFNGYRPIPSD